MTPARPNYRAQAFNPALGEEGIEGTIVLDLRHLHFQAASGLRQIPLARLDIEMDPESPGRVCFRDPQDPAWTICTWETAILEAGPLLDHGHTRNQIRAMQGGREWKRRLQVVGAFVAGFAVLAFGGSIVTSLMVRSLVAKIPAEWERRLGDDVMAKLKQEETFVQDPKLTVKLNQAVEPLSKSLAGTNRSFKFYIMEEPMANAFALPGGHVVVTTGLLELAEKPEEIAGVVAHELAHVKLKHGFRKIVASAGPFLICKVFLGGGKGALGLLSEGSELLVRQGFSQEYELEADSVGWDYLVAAGVDPRGLAEMLRRLQAEEDRLKGFQGAIPAFSSHPAMPLRIQRLDEKWRKLKDKSRFT